MTIQHTIGTYRDGHTLIEFCRYCGKEGSELRRDSNCHITNFFDDEKLTAFQSGLRYDPLFNQKK